MPYTVPGELEERYERQSYVYWTVCHLDSTIKIDQLDVTCFIISLFTAQRVSNVSTSIFRSLRIIVDLFHVLYCSGSMCVGVTVWFGWGGVVSGCRLKHCFSLYKDFMNIWFCESCRPLLTILSQTNSVHPPPPQYFKIYFVLCSHLSLGLQSGLFPPCSPTKILYANIRHLNRATCPDHLILLDLITKIIYGKECVP